ncbi:radical SAM protein [Chitinophaga agrisoli]|uniref:Radical SAM protein n=1 Tax=Chitinophaga agrisoli TaxID=2607653 RepID=A0A5B2VUR6_9BACT|nr:radical SAM protein [Chitinophaga agrisoli]KAA2243513.1 radical SAM protein [Chitinophaga agrisoli]
MKFSQFNNIIPYQDKVVLYNAFSNQFLLVEPMLQQLMDAAKAEADVEGLSAYHPKFYKVLWEKGFIVEDAVDEVDKVRKISESVDSNETFYHLIINPTMNCNFKCWYCYETHIKDSKMTEPTLDNVKKHITSVLQNKPELKTLHVDWFGGEPLLYFDKVIDPLLSYTTQLCKERNVEFASSFTTNAFLINDRMIERFKLYNIMSFQITLDGNKAMHNTVRYVSANRGSYDEIVANVIKLCRAGFHITLRINYSKNTLTDLEEVAKDLQPLEQEFRKNLVVTFHKVWQEKEEDLGTRVDELLQIFHKHGINAVTGGLPDNVRNSCYGDRRNQATINYNGEVFKCTARNFSSDAKEGQLNEDGSITWNEKYEKRMNIKFKNKPCLSCPIMPICNGGCSQQAVEHDGKDYCVYNFSEHAKKEAVLNKFLKIVYAKTVVA